MSLTVAKILLGWTEDVEQRHQESRKRKLEAARILLEKWEKERGAERKPQC
jgi:hypothetical protein